MDPLIIQVVQRNESRITDNEGIHKGVTGHETKIDLDS